MVPKGKEKGNLTPKEKVREKLFLMETEEIVCLTLLPKMILGFRHICPSPVGFVTNLATPLKVAGDA